MIAAALLLGLPSSSPGGECCTGRAGVSVPPPGPHWGAGGHPGAGAYAGHGFNSYYGPGDFSPDYYGPGSWQPGGYEGRIGSPYYYSPLGPGRQYWYGGLSGAPAHAAYLPGYGGWDAGPAGTFGGSYGAYGDPYSAHFGPGFHRHMNYGHYRAPYYTYRSPWYFPGPAVWNRDTNFTW